MALLKPSKKPPNTVTTARTSASKCISQSEHNTAKIISLAYLVQKLWAFEN